MNKYVFLFNFFLSFFRLLHVTVFTKPAVTQDLLYIRTSTGGLLKRQCTTEYTRFVRFQIDSVTRPPEENEHQFWYDPCISTFLQIFRLKFRKLFSKISLIFFNLHQGEVRIWQRRSQRTFFRNISKKTMCLLKKILKWANRISFLRNSNLIVLEKCIENMYWAMVEKLWINFEMNIRKMLVNISQEFSGK